MKSGVIKAFLIALTTFLATANAREFKNKKGVSIEAEIKEVLEGKVTIIHAKDQKEFTIPVDTLSDDDQEFIKEWEEEKKAAEAQEKVAEESEKMKKASALKGGKTTINFPELVKDRRGQETQIGISLPNSYDPNQKYPLLVFMQGADGSNAPSGKSIMKDDGYIYAGLPFPMGMNDERQARMVGDFKRIWSEYHEPMLKRLFEEIPNIDRKLCILGGFSNGAHCIAGVLDEVSPKGYLEYFNCFIVCEGGMKGSLKGNSDTHFLVMWGETSKAGPGVKELLSSVKGKCVSFEMPATAHTFAPVGKDKAREWINKVVIPDTLGE